ncbi:MAG: acyl-CoA dehydrogenase family protein [Chloroflexi bacterium]|nr:acyl-CoA dehydrogenase family protein [Chloroflexota bacterium]
MDFRLDPEVEAFRKEARAWIKQQIPPDWDQRERLLDYEEPDGVVFSMDFQRKLAQKGWLVPHWPKEYGGQGDHMKHMVLTEELAYWGLPSGGQPVNQVASILMAHGTDEQKKHFLSGLAQVKWKWAEGYSEPSGGSDLANIQTYAVEDGDDFVINGSKIWNSAHIGPDYMFGLVRTDLNQPKHRGISFLIWPMNVPGIAISKVPMMWGRSRALVTFDNMRVPKSCVIGERERGFYVAMGSLDVQRATLDRLANARRLADWLVEYARVAKFDGQKVIDRPGIRNQLAEIMMAVECYKMMIYKVAWMQSKSIPSTRESSIAKIFGPDLMQRACKVGMQMIGAYGLLEPGSKWAPLYGKIENQYLENFARTIGSGTSEINRNVVATRGLGLPRG